jgi:hypothetical protein
MLGLYFLVLILIAFFRGMKFLIYDLIWKINKEAYTNALKDIFVNLVQYETLMVEFVDMIDPFAGIGVEDSWLSGRDQKVKENAALSQIMADDDLKDIIEMVVSKQNIISKSVVKHHFMIALLEGWNHKLNRNKKYRDAQPEIEHAVKLIKSGVKSNFKKLVETESKESLLYRYGVVFYRKYTFNLYQSAFAIISFPFFPIAYYMFIQRQPYFKSLEELIEDLNQSDHSSPINLDDFEASEIARCDSQNQDAIMEINANYLNNKINRTFFWIVSALLGATIFLWIVFPLPKSILNNGDVVVFLVYAVFFLLIGVHKIFLYISLKKLHPNSYKKGRLRN